jgi:hypothetical protein
VPTIGRVIVSEVVNRFERDHVELVDQAAVDTVAMIRSRLVELETAIAEEAASQADVDEEIGRLQGQIAWLQSVIDEKKRVVEIASKVEDTRSVEIPFDGDEYGIFFGGLRGGSGGGDTPVLVRGWDKPAIRVDVRLAAYDEDADVARARLDSVLIHADGDAARAVEDFHDRDTWTRERLEEELPFRHTDILPILTATLDSGPVLSIEIADQAHITTEYEEHRHSAPSVEFPGVTIHVPAMRTLRIVASAATVENVAADVEAITHGGAGSFTDITGDLTVLARTSVGGAFVHGSGMHTAKRIERDSQLTVARIGGAARVETDDSPIRLREIAGTIRARTVVGDIQWTRRQETGVSMRLESDFGTIRAEDAAIAPQYDDWKWWGTPDPLYAGTGIPDETLDAHIQLFTVAGHISVTNDA